MIGCFVLWKCFVACLLGDESQQPTCPHSRQRRRWTQVAPIFRQSSQPSALGVTSRIWSRCLQVATGPPCRLSARSSHRSILAASCSSGKGETVIRKLPSGGYRLYSRKKDAKGK